MGSIPAFGEADLTNCDREPIHVPGSIQPYGLLLAMDPQGLVIEQVAGDTVAVLGLAAEDLLGRPLAGIIGDAAAARVAALAAHDQQPPRTHVLLGAVGEPGRTAHDAIFHVSDGVALLDLVPRAAEEEEPLAIVQTMLGATRGIEAEGSLHASIANTVRAATGYDRVLIYRFAQDGSGEVVAEAREPELESLMGLHYPASDVPRQARELYRKNWLRLIPDRRYAPAPITPAINPRTRRPVDLSLSVLRSVSPIHLEYMANMGVTASMTLSLIVGGELWGMVACHHRTPRMLDMGRRVACELFAQMISLQLEARLETQRASERLRCREVAAALLLLADRDGPAQGLTAGWPDLQDLICSDGAAYWRGGDVTVIGKTPSAAQIAEIVRFLDGRMDDGLFVTDELVSLDPSFKGLADVAAGVIALALATPPQTSDVILWFRAEAVRAVTWAGNPHKPVDVGEAGERLTPRKSFEAWRETVRLKSTPWTVVEVEAARTLRVSLLEVVLHHREEVLRERRKAQAQQDLLLAELDHRVKNTLATIQALVTLSSKTADSLADFTLSFRQRLHAMARAHMRIAENRWEGVMLARLVEDQLSIARPAGAGGWSMAGADVVVSPQIGLALSLALHELAGNAIQHGALSGPDGRVEVAWTVEERADGDRLRFTWTESGGPPVGAPGPAGFGRTLIERSLAHDIGGAVELDFRPEGLVCRIEMPLSARTPATGQGEAPQASGQRVLVVEDNALVALEVETILADAGHTVVGPAGRVSEALDLVERGSFDIALLDIDLHGDRVWPVADALAARGVPFAFTTGFRGEIIIPERFSSVEFLGKPYREADLLALTRRLLARVAPPRA